MEGFTCGKRAKCREDEPKAAVSGDAMLLLLELRWLWELHLRIQSAWFIHLKSWTDNNGSSSSPRRYDQLSQAAFSLSVFPWPPLEAPDQLIIAQTHTALRWTHLFIHYSNRNRSWEKLRPFQLYSWGICLLTAIIPVPRRCWAPRRHSTLSWMSVWITS